MKPQINIIIQFQIEAIHCWPEAKEHFPQVAYLSDLHRHIFFISCEKEVSHADRDIEIILFKRKVKEFLLSRYFDDLLQCCNFGRRSCEDLSLELYKEFELDSCKVLEDNENGSVVKSKNILNG